MLTRILGLGLGLGLATAGLYELMAPRRWSEQAEDLVEDYAPGPVRENLMEYTRLSPDSVRLMGIGKLVVGWMMLRMAFL